MSRLSTYFTSGLWTHSNFKKLWVGHTSSWFASHFVMVLIPLVAVVSLDASPIQMGIVGAAPGIPAIVGLFMGVWVDRRTRLPILIVADTLRIVLALIIPIAFAFDFLTMELIYFVAFGLGATSLLWEIAQRSLLPTVVEESQLLEANSKLEIGNSGATAIGAGLAGVIADIVAPPIALVGSAVGNLVSVFSYRSIQVEESDHRAEIDQLSILRSVNQGLQFVWAEKRLMGILIAGSSLSFWGAAFDAIYVLFLVDQIGLTPTLIGILFSLGAGGMLIASVISNRLSTSIGVGPLLILAFVAMSVAAFLAASASGDLWLAFGMVVIAELGFIAGLTAWNITQVSYRQSVTPNYLLGRVSSVFTVISRLASPIGALVGGFVGEFVGIRPSMFVSSVGITSSIIILILFGFLTMRVMPERRSETLAEETAEP